LLFVRKDGKLGGPLIKFLVTHWPLVSDHKSELFIDELIQMLDELIVDSINANIRDILRCIAMAVESPSLRLADKGMTFLQHPQVQEMIRKNHLVKDLFIPIYRAAQGHWHRVIQVKGLTIMNMLMEVDVDALREATSNLKTEEQDIQKRMEKKKRIWERVARVARSKDIGVDMVSLQHNFDEFFGTGSGNANVQ
jgi:hypothetical protein